MHSPSDGDPVCDCDRLAANPYDPDRVAAGIPQALVDLPAAIAACRQATAERPSEARQHYQLGRVLYYSGDRPASIAAFERAAELGYRQAAFMLGLFASRPDDPTFDYARTERYWRTSAAQGRLAAQIGYVRAVVKGWFVGLPTAPLPRPALLALLDAAARNSDDPPDYFARLLIEDLRSALAASPAIVNKV